MRVAPVRLQLVVRLGPLPGRGLLGRVLDLPAPPQQHQQDHQHQAPHNYHRDGVGDGEGVAVHLDDLGGLGGGGGGGAPVAGVVVVALVVVGVGGVGHHAVALAGAALVGAVERPAHLLG